MLTVSDRCARGERPDEGGPLGERILEGAGAEVVAQAFAAARELIDRIKAEAAIWKKEIFAGSSAWVGIPRDD